MENSPINEAMWQIIQIMMWGFGIQIAILIALLTTFWLSMNKKFDDMNKKFDDIRNEIKDVKESVNSLRNVVLEIDRRTCRLEGAFASKDCCMIKEHKKEKVE